MPDEYNESPRIEYVAGNAIYNNYHGASPQEPSEPLSWGWLGGLAAVLALGSGALAFIHLHTTVFYCASRNRVKYHTNATCYHLKRHGANIKSTTLAQARSKMDLCKVCH